MHEAFDPEPYRDLPHDEPKTPLWLPALGLALLLALGLAWVAQGSDSGERTDQAATASQRSGPRPGSDAAVGNSAAASAGARLPAALPAGARP